MPLRAEFLIAGAALISLCAPAAAQAQAASATPSPSTGVVQYDDVGQAGWASADLAGLRLEHGSLPDGSFAEVTNLANGKTVLAMVKGGLAPGGNRLADLSAALVARLGGEGSALIPVRIRRVNPPVFEQAALRNGEAAGDRLPTPEPLLAALRRMLSEKGGAKAIPSDHGPLAEIAATTAQQAGQAPPVPARPRKPVPAKPLPVKPPPAKPLPKPEPAVTSMPEPGDRFIVEGQGANASTPPAAVKPAAPVPRAGGFQIQVASFAKEAGARATAAKVGGQVVRAGPYWRVFAGPYASQADANAALSRIRAKGFRDARVIR